MRPVMIAVLVALGSSAASCTAQQAPPAQPATPARPATPAALDVQRTIVNWLECEECNEGELKAVIALGDRAVGPLGEYLRSGPPQQSIDQLTQHLIATYQEKVAIARAPGPSAPPMTQDQTVALYVGNYVRLYKTRAASALGAIGGANARAQLTQSQSQQDTDVANAVQKALARASR